MHKYFLEKCRCVVDVDYADYLAHDLVDVVNVDVF